MVVVVVLVVDVVVVVVGGGGGGVDGKHVVVVSTVLLLRFCTIVFFGYSMHATTMSDNKLKMKRNEKKKNVFG